MTCSDPLTEDDINSNCVVNNDDDDDDSKHFM